MAVVYPKTNLVVAWSGGKNRLRTDQPWDKKSKLVKERPDLFRSTPRQVYGVEQATRAPGERRGPSRGRPGRGKTKPVEAAVDDATVGSDDGDETRADQQDDDATDGDTVGDGGEGDADEDSDGAG